MGRCGEASRLGTGELSAVAIYQPGRNFPVFSQWKQLHQYKLAEHKLCGKLSRSAT